MAFRLPPFTVFLSAALLGPLTLSAAQPGSEPPIDHLIDRAVPPETIADAIVDFVPRQYMPLHVASPNKRTFSEASSSMSEAQLSFLPSCTPPTLSSRRLIPVCQ